MNKLRRRVGSSGWISWAVVAAVALLLVPHVAGAESLTSDRVLANETGLAYNNTYFMSLDESPNISMQVTYGSATFANGTFTDGTLSTGSLTVVSFTALSSATASAQINISSNTALVGRTLYIAGVNIPIRVDLNTSSNTACNIAADIAAQTVFLSTCAAGIATGIVYTTAPVYGTYWNQFSVDNSSRPALSTTTFSGGRDNQSFVVNGKTFLANRDFFPVTSTAQTATNIATAITNSSTTINVVAQAGATSTTLVTTTSTLVGTTANFAMSSSSNAALTLSNPVTLSGSAGSTTMTGGTSSGYTISVGTITLTAHGFTRALPVLYSTGTVAIAGLTNQTTYFVIPVDANTFMLATTQAKAQASTNDVVPTSSSTQTTAHTYTLAPLAIAGTPSFKWQVSNDRANWGDLTTTLYNVTVSSVTLLSYTAGGSNSFWDLGPIDYHYMRMNVIAPTQGGITLKAYVHGKSTK